MKTLKSLFLVAFAFLAMAFAPCAQAQNYNLQYIGVPLGTLNIAATSTNTTMSATNGTAVFLRGITYAAFQPSFKLTGAGTSPCVFTFDSSVDNVSWTAAAFTISVTASTTNLVSTTSNQTIGSIGYYRLAGVTNPNATAITNLYVAVSSKTP